MLRPHEEGAEMKKNPERAFVDRLRQVLGLEPLHNTSQGKLSSLRLYYFGYDENGNRQVHRKNPAA